MSNTFITPGSGTAIAIARTNWNESLLALLTNFYSTSAPTSGNITLIGTATTPPDGTLYMSAKTNTLFVVNSVKQKGNPVHGGNFTRNGIAWRVEETLATTDIDIYEVGEAFATLGAGTANVRLYIRSSNVSGEFVDVGTPPDSSITSVKIVANAVTNTKIANNSVTSRQIEANSVTNVKIAHKSINVNQLANVVRIQSSLGVNTNPETAVAIKVAGQAYSSRINLTDNTTLIWNAALGMRANVTLEGNRTLQIPDNLKDGADYQLIVRQDGTGSRTLAYGSGILFPGGSAPTLSSGAGNVDILSFTSNGSHLFGVAQLNFV